MTAIVSRQRKRLLAAMLCGIGAACLLPIGGVYGARTLLNSSGGKNVDASGALKIPATPAALLVTVNDVNVATSLTAFVLDPSGAGGTIVSIPVGSRAEIIGNEAPRRVGDSFTQAGLAALQLDVEGLLDVSFSVVGAVSATDITNVFSMLPTVDVTFDVPMINTALVMPDPATTTTVKRRSSETTLPPQPIATDTEVFPAGTQTLTADQMTLTLMAQKLSEPESTRLPRIKSLWAGIASAVGTGLPPEQLQLSLTSTPNEVPTDIGTFMRRVFAGPVQVWQLSAQPLSGADNPALLDLYALDRFEVLMIMASVAPSSLSLPSGSLAIQVDSSLNDANITRAVVERLNYIGASVVLIRELTDTAPQQTTFRYSDKAMLELAKVGLEAVLGPLKYEQLKKPVEGISAQIVIGQDFVDFLGSSPALPPTTIAADE
jgi:hypothetical protein